MRVHVRVHVHVHVHRRKPHAHALPFFFPKRLSRGSPVKRLLQTPSAAPLRCRPASSNAHRRQWPARVCHVWHAHLLSIGHGYGGDDDDPFICAPASPAAPAAAAVSALAAAGAAHSAPAAEADAKLPEASGDTTTKLSHVPVLRAGSGGFATSSVLGGVAATACNAGCCRAFGVVLMLTSTLPAACTLLASCCVLASCCLPPAAGVLLASCCVPSGVPM